jgi:hypothetical protein
VSALLMSVIESQTDGRLRDADTSLTGLREWKCVPGPSVTFDDSVISRRTGQGQITLRFILISNSISGSNCRLSYVSVASVHYSVCTHVHTLV